MLACALWRCSRLFSVCGPCDSGRRYCGRECAREARRLQQRDASRAYQLTDRGRRAHAERQARYRRRATGVTQHSPAKAPTATHRASETSPSHTGKETAQVTIATAVLALAGSSAADRGVRAEPVAARARAPNASRVQCCVRCGRDTRFIRLRFRHPRASAKDRPRLRAEPVEQGKRWHRNDFTVFPRFLVPSNTAPRALNNQTMTSLLTQRCKERRRVRHDDCFCV
jgi:hypothetical protein